MQSQIVSKSGVQGMTPEQREREIANAKTALARLRAGTGTMSDVGTLRIAVEGLEMIGGESGGIPAVCTFADLETDEAEYRRFERQCRVADCRRYLRIAQDTLSDPEAGVYFWNQFEHHRAAHEIGPEELLVTTDDLEMLERNSHLSQMRRDLREARSTVGPQGSESERERLTGERFEFRREALQKVMRSIAWRDEYGVSSREFDIEGLLVLKKQLAIRDAALYLEQASGRHRMSDLLTFEGYCHEFGLVASDFGKTADELAAIRAACHWELPLDLPSHLFA